jgi:hypothetical protein
MMILSLTLTLLLVNDDINNADDTDDVNDIDDANDADDANANDADDERRR